MMRKTGWSFAADEMHNLGASPVDPAQWKVSRYCLACRALVAGQVLVFNAFTGSLLELSEQDYDLVQSVLEGNTTSTGNAELDRRLVQSGVLLPNDFDELDALRGRRHDRRPQGYLGVTIAPTLRCNFRCTYCFERHPSETMSAETESALCRFIEERATESAGLGVTWYGGEPLMALDTIVRVQRFVNELGERLDAPVTREMITNGYLLGTRTIRTLLELGDWNHIQVTIDGVPEVHNRRRPLVSGRGTWNKIVRNCRAALDAGLPLAIRMNVDSTSLLDFQELISLLTGAGILPRASLYLGGVAASTPECEHVKEQVLRRQQFADAKLKLYTQLLSAGLSPRVRLPVAECAVCTADVDNGFVIAPSGLIFKCWEEIAMGPEQAVGHLSEPATAQQQRNAEAWRAYDPLRMTGCLDCPALPVCMGGCPMHNRRNAGEIGDCDEFLFHPSEVIQIAHAEMALNKHLQAVERKLNAKG
jgi:uncharacterized protein